MTEYALATFGFLALSGMLSLILYGEGRAERGAIGIIAAFIIISPLVTFFTDMDFSFLDDIAKERRYRYDSRRGFRFRGADVKICSSFLLVVNPL